MLHFSIPQSYYILFMNCFFTKITLFFHYFSLLHRLRHATFLASDFYLDPLFIIFDGAFRPKMVKAGALSAPTLDMLLKYCLDLSYIQLEFVNFFII